MTDQEFEDIKLIAEFDGYSWFLIGVSPTLLPKNHTIEKHGGGKLTPCDKPDHWFQADLSYLPDYRNDLNAIVQVAEKICDKLGNRWRFCVHSPMKIDSHYNKYEAYFEDYQGNEDESVGHALEPSLSEALFQACLKALDYLKQRETNG